MHALSRVLHVAFENHFGKGGLFKKTVLQVLHTAWSIQDAMGEQFIDIWKIFVHGGEPEAAGDVMEIICKPLLTRWGYIMQCADAVLDRWNEWLVFYTKKRFDDIAFNFTNGWKFEYQKWRDGKSLIVKGDKKNGQ